MTQFTFDSSDDMITAINPLLTEEVRMTRVNAEVNAYNEGKQAIRKIVLDFLEEKYMSKNVKRGTQYSEEILELTRELGRRMRDA